MKKLWMVGAVLLAAIVLLAAFWGLPTGSSLTWKAPQEFTRGIVDYGPKAMIALQADNHTQDDIMESDGLHGMSMTYSIPFTFFLARGINPDSPPSADKTNTPAGTTLLTNTELATLAADSLIEIGGHGHYHHDIFPYTAGIAEIAGTTIRGHGTSWNTGLNPTIVANDIIWLYGADGPQPISAITNDVTLVATQTPSVSTVRTMYYIDRDTIEGDVTCNGGATVDYLEADWPGTTDPPDTRVMAPIFTNETPDALGGLLWIVGSANGNPYYIIGSNPGGDQLTLNRACDSGVKRVAYLAGTPDSAGTSWLSSKASIQADIVAGGGVANHSVTSFGGPGNHTETPLALAMIGRGARVLTSGGPTTNLGFNGLHSFSRYDMQRRHSTMFWATPEQFRNIARAAIDADSLYTINFESTGDSADWTDSTKTLVANSATSITCSPLPCAFVSPALASDFLIIDSSCALAPYKIASISGDTNTLTLDAPGLDDTDITSGYFCSTAAASDGSIFWIINNSPSTASVFWVKEIAATFFSYLNDNRIDIMPLKVTDAADRAESLRGITANLIQNPNWRVTGIMGDPDVCGTGCIGASSSDAYQPWDFILGGQYCEPVTRYGQTVMKCDTSAEVSNVDVHINQEVLLRSDTTYSFWLELEIESLDSAPTNLKVDVSGLHYGFSGNPVSDNIQLNATTEVTNNSGANVAGVYYIHDRLRVAAPPAMMAEVTQPTTLSRAIGLIDEAPTSSGTGVTTLRFAPELQKGFPVVTPTSTDTACVISTLDRSFIIVTCTDLAGVAKNGSFVVQIPHDPTTQPLSTLQNRRALPFEIELDYDGIIYIRPVVLVPEVGFQERDS